MANQKLAREDVGYCFGLVKDLIENLPEKTFPYGSKLEEKKKMADLALGLLENFFENFKGIKKDEIKEFANINVNWNYVADYLCGLFPTVNIP